MEGFLRDVVQKLKPEGQEVGGQEIRVGMEKMRGVLSQEMTCVKEREKNVYMPKEVTGIQYDGCRDEG